MGGSSSTAVTDIIQQVAPVLISSALAALESGEVAAVKRSPQRRRLGDDPATELDRINKITTQDNKNSFGHAFGYIYNGQLSRPPNQEPGTKKVPSDDFCFFSTQIPELNNIQQYVNDILQPVVAEGYVIDSIATAIDDKLQEIYAGQEGAWVSFTQTFTAVNPDNQKEVELDLSLYSFCGLDNNGNKMVMFSTCGVCYGCQTFDVLNVTEYLRRKSARHFYQKDDGHVAEVSLAEAGKLKEQGVMVVPVYGKKAVGGRLFGGISGSSTDKRCSSWITLWRNTTGISGNVPCADVLCQNVAVLGGHTYYQAFGDSWYITPICYEHNATVWDGNNTMKARAGTIAVEIAAPTAAAFGLPHAKPAEGSVRLDDSAIKGIQEQLSKIKLLLGNSF